MQKHCGLDQATGRIIVLTDDDCRLAPDDLTALVQAYDGDVGPALRGGRVELGDTRDLPFTIKTDLEPQQFTGGNPGGLVHGCNLTMSRSVVELVGCFDTSLGPGQPIGTADDTDFVYRAYRTGVPVLYDPSMLHVCRNIRGGLREYFGGPLPTRNLDSATGKFFGVTCVAQYCFGVVSDTSLSSSR
jgi:GT2 family glycosyltransferase